MNQSTTTSQPAPQASWPKRHPILTGVAVVVGLLVAIGAFASPGTSSTPSAPFAALPTSNAEHDVKITKCGGDDQFGMNSVTVRITNSTDRTQSYFVTASMNDAAGNRLGEANGASNSVAPGQSANAQLIGTGAKGVAACTVANVSRIPS